MKQLPYYLSLLMVGLFIGVCADCYAYDKATNDLRWAIFAGNIERARTALQAGANVNAFDVISPSYEGSKTMCINAAGAFVTEAAQRGDVEMVKLLLSRKTEHLEHIIRYLSYHYADDIRMRRRNKFVDNAHEIFRLLFKHGSSSAGIGLEVFEAAIQSGDKEMITLLLDYGTSVNGRLPVRFSTLFGYSSGPTPLTFAIEEGKLDIVNLLISRGALIDQEAMNAAAMHPIIYTALMKHRLSH